MSLQEFLDKYSGVVNTGNTPENKGECVGLISVWMDSFGIPHEFGNARDLLTNADTNFVNVVQNSPTNVPLPGDIMVWGTQVGQYGHTAIFVSGDQNTFTSFDQNWPLNSAPHLQSHNYSGVIGWLHPKNAIITQPAPQPSTGPLTETNINDTYRALCGVEASADEIKARLDSQINLYDLIKEICSGDSRFKDTWIPAVNTTPIIVAPSPIITPKTPSNPVPTPITSPQSKSFFQRLLGFLVGG